MAPEPVLTEAQRLKSLREAHDLKIEQIAKATGLKPSTLRNYETRGVPASDDVRVRLATAYGFTSRDEFARYLSGAMTLDEATAKLPRGAVPPPGSAERSPRGPVLRAHPEWADLALRAAVKARTLESPLEIDPDTMRSVGLRPWLFGPLEEVEVDDVIDIARILLRRRRP